MAEVHTDMRSGNFFFCFKKIPDPGNLPEGFILALSMPDRSRIELLDMQFAQILFGRFGRSLKMNSLFNSLVRNFISRKATPSLDRANPSL